MEERGVNDLGGWLCSYKFGSIKSSIWKRWCNIGPEFTHRTIREHSFDITWWIPLPQKNTINSMYSGSEIPAKTNELQRSSKFLLKHFLKVFPIERLWCFTLSTNLRKNFPKKCELFRKPLNIRTNKEFPHEIN